MRGRKINATGWIAAALAVATVAAVSWTLVSPAPPARRGAPEERNGAESPAAAAAASSGSASIPVPLPAFGEATGVAPAASAPPSNGEDAAGANPEQQRAAEKLTRRMKRFLSDLEYSPGQAEPPQQVVAPMPPPWRPDPGNAGLPEPVIDQISPRAGAEGTYVRIGGKNLRASQVMFGDHPAEIVSDADDELTVLVPEGHGTVTVVVTNADGTYAIAADAFTYP